MVQVPKESVHTAAVGEMWGMSDFLWCDCVVFRCVYFKHTARDTNKTAIFTWSEKQTVSDMFMCRHWACKASQQPWS